MSAIFGGSGGLEGSSGGLEGFGVDSGGLEGSSGGLEGLSESSDTIDSPSPRVPTYSEIVPKTGRYLGLDISKTSSGIAIFDNGTLEWYNADLETSPNETHYETLLRRELKGYLEEATQGRDFDAIILEDVYVGDYAQTARTLISLNTAIDELILDGIISTKAFVRVQNSTWKRWLRLSDPQKMISAANDKILVEALLARLGLETSGKGSQDRLDAAGMVVGYCLAQIIGDTESPTTVSRKEYIKSLPPLSKIECSYESNVGELSYPRHLEVVKYRGRIDENRIRSAAFEVPNTVHVTEKRITVGNLIEKMGVEPLPYGGYLAFWYVP